MRTVFLNALVLSLCCGISALASQEWNLFGLKNMGSKATGTPIHANKFELPTSKISAEVLWSLPQKTNKDLPPLVFLHGSFHGAWCWSEHYFEYFTNLGYPVVALNWRGTSGTFAGEGVRKVKAGEHCEDLRGFLSLLPDIIGKNISRRKPVLISHSFGGIIVMKYLETVDDPSDELSGIVNMCSVPPSGNGRMTMRFLRRSLVQSWKITSGFAMKKCLKDSSLCRELFFGKVIETDEGLDDRGVSDADLERYQSYFAKDVDATIDLLDLAKHLPSKIVDENGRAPFVSSLPPCMVLGATDDFIVDPEGNVETANYFGLDKPVFVDSPHDVMLGRNWREAAREIESFLRQQVCFAGKK